VNAASGDHDHDDDTHKRGVGHSHSHVTLTEDTDSRRLAVALALIVGFMAVEVVVGILFHSLALLSDAGHMLTDAGALAMSLVVIRLVSRPAAGNRTFGLKRTEILSAQANGATLLVLAVLIIYEGIHRLVSPPPAGGVAILVVALVGIAVNLFATWQLSKANRESMNIEGSFQHILTDLLAFVFTAIAGAVIIFNGFTRADGIASLIIALIMIRAAYGLLKDSGRILLEIAPQGMSVEAIGGAMAGFPGVAEVHDLHVWEVASGFPSLSAHVLVGEEEDCHGIRRDLERMLGERFTIDHTTLQVDHRGEERLLQIGAAREPEAAHGKGFH
jgi:cobalt-zinc-cadmium efflux system protein